MSHLTGRFLDVSQIYPVLNAANLTQRALRDQLRWVGEVVSKSSCCFRNMLVSETVSIIEISDCVFALGWGKLPNHPR